eukprot:1190119-Prorocentrum_minimum.AAC.5
MFTAEGVKGGARGGQEGVKRGYISRLEVLVVSRSVFSSSMFTAEGVRGGPSIPRGPKMFTAEGVHWLQRAHARGVEALILTNPDKLNH